MTLQQLINTLTDFKEEYAISEDREVRRMCEFITYTTNVLQAYVQFFGTARGRMSAQQSYWESSIDVINELLADIDLPDIDLPDIDLPDPDVPFDPDPVDPDPAAPDLFDPGDTDDPDLYPIDPADPYPLDPDPGYPIDADPVYPDPYPVDPVNP